MTESPITYGLLGMLATRSWTGYELTAQLRRSLRFVWGVSEGHLYREQKRLVSLGWATVVEEPAGRRTRQRYTITPAGRRALKVWHATAPEEPHLQVEGVLRAFYADTAAPEELARAMRATAGSARAMLDELCAFADEYLAPGGPLEMLEDVTAHGPFLGRPMFPERLPAVALALDVTSRLLETLDDFFTATADEVAGWSSTTDAALAPATRVRLERVRRRVEALRATERGV